MSAPLVPAAVSFLAGVFAGSAIRPPLAVLVIGAAAAAWAAWRWRARRQAAVALCALWLLLGMLRIGIWNQHPRRQLGGLLPQAPSAMAVHGVVLDEPQPVSGPHAEDRWVCLLSLRHYRAAQGWVRAEGVLRITLDKPRIRLHAGDRALLEGRWSQAPSPGNPGQYDRRAALAREGIGGLMRVAPCDGIAVLARSRPFAVFKRILDFRRRCAQALQETRSEPHAGLLTAMLLGSRVALDERLRLAFVETGTMHLLVVSGFNVGVIALLLEMILRLAGFSFRWRPWLVAAGVGAYGLFTGWQPPVARATVMAWMVLGARVLDRDVCWMNLLAAAALILVLIEPAQLFDPSFQLSFGAVASLIVFVPRWQPLLNGLLPHGWPGWPRQLFSATLTATAAVWVGLAPILAGYFHQVTPVALAANLLLGPLVSLLVAAGTPLLILAGLHPPWMGAVVNLLKPLVDTIGFCVTAAAAVPYGNFLVGRLPLVIGIVYYGLLLLTLCRGRLRLDRVHIGACWLLALAIGAGALVAGRVASSRWLRVDVLDVGHGDSILIRAPAGRSLLVDAGSEQAGKSALLPFLRHEGLASLDGLLLTHTDEDHIGGAIPLLEAVRVRRLLTNGVWGDTMAARRLRQAVAARRLLPQALAKGQLLDLGGGVSCEVLHPPAGGVPGASLRSNDNGMALKLTKGSVSFLLTADIEEAGLPWLTDALNGKPVTVLKAPHHGSRLGEAGEVFFRQAHPQVAVVSVGRLHRLPAPQTMEALHNTGAAVYTTRDSGMVSLRTDGRRLEACAFRGQQCRQWMIGE